MQGRSEEHTRRAAQAARAASRLGPEAAADLLEAALGALPPLPCLTAPLADALESLGRDEAVVALCRRVLEADGDAREQPLWQLRLAEASERLGDVAAAVSAHRAVLDVAPRERRSLRALQRIHRAAGEKAALVRTLESELALCAGQEEIAPRLELAGLLAGPLERDAEALLHLRRVLDLEPGRDGVLERALALAEGLGAASDQVALLDIALARAETPGARARVLARQAALLAGPLASPEKAVARWREALAQDPRLPGIREPLRCTLERLGDWPALLEGLLEEVREAGPDTRQALLERGARLAGERFGADAALPWLARMHANAPGDPAPLERMAALHRDAGRREALRATLHRLAGLPVPGPHDAAVADARAAHAPRPPAPLSPRPPVPPGAPGGAPPPEARPVTQVRVRGPAAAASGTAPPAAPSGEDAAEEARRAEAELAALDPLAPVYAERRRVLERRLARLYAGPLADPERAIRFLRAVAASPDGERSGEGPERERAWAEDALLALLRREGSFLELEARLSARLARAPDDPAGWLELAALREDDLHTPAAAADAYREALRHGAPACRALEGLRRASRRLGDWREVARCLEAELEAEPSRHDEGAASGAGRTAIPPRRRAALLRELGEVAWHRLGATTRASRAFAGALEADPRDLVSLRSLRALLASMEDWRGALDLLESEIELLPPGDGGGRRALWIEAAEIAADRVHDPERALRALEAADALSPLETPERRRLAMLLHRSGDLERYVAVATALLERTPGADADEWLRLGHACLGLGRPDAARLHAKQAVVKAPDRDAAWELLAEAELAQGRRSEAAESLRRAADASGPTRAVARLLRAAALVAPEDAELAHGLCEAACSRDPGNGMAWLRRAGAAAATGRCEEAEEAAAVAAELLASSPEAAQREPLLETGLAAAASAEAGGRGSHAARILTALLAVFPGNAELLRAQTLVLRRSGDATGAMRAAAALFAADAAASKEPLLVLTLAEGLAAEGLLEEAAERFAEAASADPGLDAAWAGLSSSLEACGRIGEAVDALDAWARVAPMERRIQCRLRAAELAFRSDERGKGFEARLRRLLAEDPGCTRGAALLARHLVATDRAEEACDVAAAARRSRRPGEPLAPLARIHARALESLDLPLEACDAWARVLEEDPGDGDAANARAALLRGRGAWAEAAATLEAFLAGAGGVAPEVAAQAWLDLAALRAGPLKDPRGAVEAHREAVRACPGHKGAREALADALRHDPAAQDEALRSHLELLEETPERVASLQALVEIAEARGVASAAADGRAILRALGMGDAAAAPRLGFRAATPGLENTVWERARRLAQSLHPELARALGASRRLEPPAGGEGVEAFRLAAIVAEAGLSAAALVPLGDEEVHGVLATAALLAAERPVVSGDGRLVNALAGALGRRARRRAREALGDTAPEEIAEIDAASWRTALRALSHAVALDATGGDLQAALRALVDEEGSGRPSGGEACLRDRVASHPAARELLRRTVLAFGRTLLPSSEIR